MAVRRFGLSGFERQLDGRRLRVLAVQFLFAVACREELHGLGVLAVMGERHPTPRPRLRAPAEFGPYSCAPQNWALRVLINPVMSVFFMPITRDAESRTVAPGQPPSDHARRHPVGSASSSGFVVRLVASWHENTACRAPRSSTTSYLIQRYLSTSSPMSPSGPTYPSRWSR